MYNKILYLSETDLINLYRSKSSYLLIKILFFSPFRLHGGFDRLCFVLHPQPPKRCAVHYILLYYVNENVM